MILKSFQKFTRKEDGGMTALGLFIGFTSIVVGGLAIDVASVMMARTQMQVAADAAAHAALYYREFETANDAKSAAVDLANVNMPSSKYGALFTTADIQFGDWDRDAQIFIPDPSSDNAVMVDMSRIASRANSVGTYFLRFAGFNSWDVRRAAVFETYIPTCFREGFVSDEIVDMQSNNTFTSGFCIHANDHVEMNISNVFENFTVVSMPSKGSVVTPSGDYNDNPGLRDALHDGAYQIRILNRLPDIIADLYSGGHDYAPAYITPAAVLSVTQKNVTQSDFQVGKIHRVDCVGNQRLRFLATNTFHDIVVVTNCRVDLGALVTLENVLIATTSTNSQSFLSAAELQIGRNDNCANGGGSQLLTMGGMNFPALLDVFGSQLIARGDISFAANATGIQGASFIAGGTISGTSNMVMGFCNNVGMENNYIAEYFRLAI